MNKMPAESDEQNQMPVLKRKVVEKQNEEQQGSSASDCQVSDPITLKVFLTTGSGGVHPHL